MEKMLSACPVSHQSPVVGQVLLIPREMFNALHPYDQLKALALEKIGKVRIVHEEEQEMSGDFFDT
jgi:hypothetical protein